MAVVGVSSISPSLPLIANELQVTSQEISLLFMVFTLPGIFIAPLIGFLADRYGRRIILTITLLIFGLAGGSCFIAPNFSTLILLRLIQGIGLASLNTLNVTVISDLYQAETRSTALGYNASVQNIGRIIFPILGGGLALIGWAYPFLLSLIAIPIALLVHFVLNPPEPINPQPFSQYLSNAGRVLKDPQLITIFIAGMLNFIIIYGPYLTFYPFLLDYRFTSSPLLIGIIMTGMPIAAFLVSSQIGKITSRKHQQQLIILAFMIYTIALGVVPFISIDVFLILPTMLIGIGNGINFPLLPTLIAGCTPEDYRGICMSVNGMSYRIGQTIGPLIMGIVLAAGGIDFIFIIGALITICTSLGGVIALVGSSTRRG